MKKPVISVIMPVFNTVGSARKMVEAILKTEIPVEVVVVDDGSREKVEFLGLDKRVKVVRQENLGASAARNRGILEAKGEFLVFVDSDDMILPGFLEGMLKEMLKPETALAMTGVRYRKVREGSEEDLYVDEMRGAGDRKTRVLQSLLRDGRIYPVFNKMFFGEVIREKGLKFDTGMKYGEDTKFVLDYLSAREGEIRMVPRALYVYNYGTETSAAKREEGKWENWRRCYENLRGFVGRGNFRQRWLMGLIWVKWRVAWMRRRNG